MVYLGRNTCCLLIYVFFLNKWLTSAQFHTEKKDVIHVPQTNAIFECINLRRLELVGSNEEELVLVEGLRNHSFTKLANVQIVYIWF